MIRRPSTQDLTWLIDLARNNQLDLDPPYQRRSVWTLKDRQFFLDTVFRNYPCPAIFLHKTVDESGRATYHVVDGKQRTQTILDFVSDHLRISKGFGDARLDGKKWSELAGESEIRQNFWNYQITIEQIGVEGGVVKEVFDRLNRNSRRLTGQELRHAKYEGWLISQVELEATRDEWVIFGITTKARAKRMTDCQFISELMLVLLEKKILGFDQEKLDALYAKYEDVPDEELPDFDEDEFFTNMERMKAYFVEMQNENACVTEFAKGFGSFYSLWALVALAPNPPAASQLAHGYKSFMEKVAVLGEQDDLQDFLAKNEGGGFAHALTYLNNSQGASTDLTQRTARLEALRAELLA